jgi:putative ABC transport system permease protein
VSVRAASGRPSLLAPGVDDALSRFNRRLTFSIRPLERDVTAAVTRERVVAMLSSFFGGLALLLSAIGLYGVTAYASARRRSEIGVRMALGASRGRVIQLILARTLGLTAGGVIAGVCVSLWASRFVASLLFGVEPRDVLALATAVLILTVVALLASAIPAARASRIDPARALRET